MSPPLPAPFLSSAVPTWRKRNCRHAASITSILVLPLLILLKLACFSSSVPSSSTSRESPLEDSPAAEAAADVASSAAFSVVASSFPPLSLPLSSSSLTSVVPAFADGRGEAAVAAAAPSLAADHAVVVVPGIAGSGLFAQITNANLPACAAHAVTYQIFRIWAALSLLLPPLSHQKCWVEMMQQQVDEKGEVYQSKPGVELQVDDYGGIHAIDFLDYYMHDSYGIPGSAYMHGMLQTLRRLHYEPFSTLRGVPYDWRLPPWQFDFSRLKVDIEERYEATGQQKVDLLAHSLGTVILLYFFNRVVDQAWKNKYIKTFTLVEAATGGSFKAVRCLLSGYGTAKDLNVWNILDVNLFPTALLRDLLRTMGSTYALLPDPQLYGPEHVVVTMAHPPSSAAPSPSYAMSPPRGAAGSGGGEGPSEFEGPEGGAVRGDGGEGGAGGEGSSHIVKDVDESGAPYRELRRRRLAAVEEEVEKASAAASDGASSDGGGSSHAGEERLRQQQQQQEQEKLRWAAMRGYAARSRMSDEERQRHRNERLHAYVHEQQQRLQQAYDKMVKDNIPTDVYTLANWTSLLPPDLQLRAKVAREKMAGVLADPGVPVRCVWSTYDTPTTEVGYVYENDNLDEMPILVFDFGDGTVPVESLSLCTSWPSTFEKHELKNVDHMYIFGNKSFNQLIESAYGPTPAPEEVAAPLSSKPLPPAIVITT